VLLQVLYKQMITGYCRSQNYLTWSFSDWRKNWRKMICVADPFPGGINSSLKEIKKIICVAAIQVAYLI